MATNIFVNIDFPEATDLADLTGIQFDLESARSLSQELKKELESEKPNFSIIDALSTTILIRYSRPFVSGVRKHLGEEALQSLTTQQQNKHQLLRAFRDKHIAHSVNAFEENQPIARYWKERVEEEGITSIECSHMRVVGLGPTDIEDVVEITTVLLGYVNSRLKLEKSKMLEVVRKIPVQEVLAYGRKGSFVLSSKKICKPRKK